MANSSNKTTRPISIKRICQINGAYCGPATLVMLLSFLHIKADQEKIIQDTQLSKKIMDYGMTIDELGKIIKTLYPELQFWYKFNSTISDLSQMINNYKYPVGIEWQGIFDYSDDEDETKLLYPDIDDDPGHIAIVTAIDTLNNTIKVADPDQHYYLKDRKFSILQFERRWWDINQIVDPITKKTKEVDDYHPMFIITSNNTDFPQFLNMSKI